MYQSKLRGIAHQAGSLLTVILLLIFSCGSAWAQSYQWNSVTIKGGGFITGILTHPGASGVMYARTDVGGVYGWNSASNTWTALTDSVTKSDWMSADGFAIDPTDVNRLYLICGQYTASWASQAAIMISTNRGSTWQTVSLPFWMGGNEDGRSNGERLAVDPNSPNIIWLGTRENGIWKSTDYGVTWNQISFPVTTTPNGAGIAFIEIIASSGTSGSPTPSLYVGVSQPTNQLYRTTNGATSWQAVSTGATATYVPHHAVQDGQGNLYITFCDVPGPNSVTVGSVRKLNLSTLASSNVTPPTGQGGFSGISVDRQNPNTIVVSTMDRWWPTDVIYRSTDGGTSYTAILDNDAIDNSSAPWSVVRVPHWIGDVEIDPFNSAKVHIVTGYGVISTTNATAANPVWFFNNDGLEETVPLDLVSPASGPNLLSALGDIGGFRHTNLNVSPSTTDYFSTHRVTTRSIDAAEQNPSVVTRTFSEPPYGAVSLDGGLTWTDFNTNQIPSAASASSGPNSITLSADGTRMAWWPRGAVPYYSTNNGSTWTASSGAPVEPIGSPAGRVTADRVNASYFYLYVSSGTNAGRVYSSVNGAVNWSLTASGLPSSGCPMVAVPGYQGHLWLPLQWNGFRRSVDGGATWTTISGFSTVNQVAFGKAASGQSYPAIYIYAQTTGSVRGLFRSTDEGATWSQINDSDHQYGWINKLAADPRIFGRVYLGTSGRGIIYGEDVTLPPPATPANFIATAGNASVTLSWSSSSGATSYNVKRSVGTSSGPYTIIASPVATNYLDTNVVNGTTYFYIVSAVNAVGESADSSYRGATPQLAAPAAPTGLSATAASSSQINLSWTASSGATSYNVKRATVSGGPYTTITTNVTATSYSNTGLSASTTYYYVVSAVNAGGESANSTQANATTLPTAPAAPTGLTATAASGSQINLSWTASSGATSYNVKRATVSGGPYTAIATNVAATSYNNTGLSASTTYYYVVSAVNTGGESANSAQANATTSGSVPSVPTGLTATRGSNQVTLAWTASSGATSYNVKRSTTSGSSYTNIATGVTMTSYTNTTAVNGTTYYYVVSAVNASGESSNSTQAVSIGRASIKVEAESGTLGSLWAVSNTSPAYITAASNNTNNNPGVSNRVATYTVTFPTATTYQLYARVRVGAGAANDDSLLYAASFGQKSVTNNADWVVVNNIVSTGFTNSTDVVTGAGTAGTGVWKWINLSKFTNKTGFAVSAGSLTQTFQIGSREDGLNVDKVVFGSAYDTFTVSQLNGL